MVETTDYIAGLSRLREVLAQARAAGKIDEILRDRDEIFARYQPLFKPSTIGQISAEEFASFLYFENNKHWYGLYRQRSRMTADLTRLQRALILLLDERQPIAGRVEQAVAMVRGLGRAVATAMLMVAYPQQYGVWNNVSEAAMLRLKVWPVLPRGLTFGQKYERVNQQMVRLAADLEVDLWTLDFLWWFVEVPEDIPGAEPPSPTVTLAAPEMQGFGLERHLHDFLRDNWERLALGQEWQLYGEPGDDSPGYEYPTHVGRIDLLARHRTQQRWLVVELKRDQSSDVTVGQVMRYMGWVKRNLAASNDQVQGLIIARRPDQQLLYALDVTPNIDLKLYEVEFRLLDAPEPGAEA
jgi:hypothetical protein